MKGVGCKACGVGRGLKCETVEFGVWDVMCVVCGM